MNPGSWESVEIEDICDILDRFRKPITKRDRKPGPIPYYGASGVLDHVEGHIFDEPLVLLGEDGAKWEAGENSAFPIDGKTWVNNHAHVLRPKRDRLLDEWLIYYLNFEDLTHFVSGLTVPKLNQKALKAIPIPLPPLSEQRRIVSVLDAAFARLATAEANTRQNLTNARELFDRYLKTLLKQGRDGWRKAKLGDVGKVAMCKRVFKKETSESGDIPFYKIGTFGKDANAFISRSLYAEYKERYSYPKRGDVLVSAAGTIGRRVQFDGHPAYFQDSNIVWIDNDESQVLNNYLYHYYGACEWKSTTGTTISRLYNDDLRQLDISFPKSLDEQAHLVKVIDRLSDETQQLETKYDCKLAALAALKQSLLHRAFRGELSGSQQNATHSTAAAKTPTDLVSN